MVGIAIFAFNTNGQAALALGGIFIALLLGFSLGLSPMGQEPAELAEDMANA